MGLPIPYFAVFHAKQCLFCPYGHDTQAYPLSSPRPKAHNTAMEKNLLALDLGKGSLGMAISRSGMFVTLLENLRFPATHYEEAVAGIREILMVERVEKFILGWPLYPSGDPCEMTPIVADFALRLEKAFPNIPIVKQDERGSTVEAAALLHEQGKNAKKQRKIIDSAAAGVILKRYLASIGQGD